MSSDSTPRTHRNEAGVEFVTVACPVCEFTHAHRTEAEAASPAASGDTLREALDWDYIGRLISDALDYTNDGAVIAKAIRDYLAASPPLPEGLDVFGSVKHALDALNEASDKAMYGDSIEGDLLEAHATLDTLLQDLDPAEYARLASREGAE